VHTCLNEKGKAKAVEKVGGGQIIWPASHVASPAGHHLASYVARLATWLGLYRWKLEHTPHLGNSTCKALILSVVSSRRIIGRVVRL
jgi:hypothetical protein